MSKKYEILAENVHLSEDGKSIIIVDQTKLPNVLEYLTLSTAQEMYDAITRYNQSQWKDQYRNGRYGGGNGSNPPPPLE